MKASSQAFAVSSIADLAAARGGQTVWSGPDRPSTWEELGRRVSQIKRTCSAAGVQPGEVLVVPGEATFDSLCWVLGGALAGAVVAPLQSVRAAERQGWGKHFRVSWQGRGDSLKPVDEGRDSPRAARLLTALRSRGHPGLVLATGGTTGTAKLVLHDLAALLAAIPLRQGQPWRTLPLMRFDHIGGLDTAWRALAGGQVLIEPPIEISPGSVAAVVEARQVQVLAATPSFLNVILLSEAHRQHDLSSLRVVPYGAEPMPSGLLDRLQAALPGVEFVQRFGTSETGALPVEPGEGGMRLRAGVKGFAWKVVEGELWVCTPSRALGYLSEDSDRFGDDGWYRTGDSAEVQPDGSVRVLGRLQEMINVGGEKVFPDEVEGFLLSHPLVSDCRVAGVANPVLGQVVGADIVWRGTERDPIAIRRTLQDYAVGRLARHKVPVTVHLVDAVAATRAGKKLRPASA